MNKIVEHMMEHEPKEYEEMVDQNQKDIEAAMDNHWSLRIAKEGVRSSIFALLKVLDKGSPQYDMYKKQYMELNEEINNHTKMMELL